MLGVAVGWNRFFSTPAVAYDPHRSFMEESILNVRNVGSFQMTVYARTTPNENFFHLDPTAGFIGIDIQLLRQNDSVFYRVEKEGGRTVVCDGTSQYAWTNGEFYAKGNLQNNFLERFRSLLYPERILAIQQSAIDLYNPNETTSTETNDAVILRTEGRELIQQLGMQSEHKVEVESRFTKNDGLLRTVKLWMIDGTNRILLIHIENIRYNVAIDKSRLIQLPDVPANCWEDINKEDEEAVISESRLAQLREEGAADAAARIIKAIINNEFDKAGEALEPYKEDFADMATDMKGCSASDFEVKQYDNYCGVYVFYRLTRPDGTKTKKYIAVRNDNPQHIWIADGGL